MDFCISLSMMSDSEASVTLSDTFQVSWPYQQVICVVKRRLLVIKRRKTHPLEVPPVTLFSPHHDPHCSPLCYVNWLDDQGHLINEADSSSNMIQDTHMFDLHTDASQLALGSMSPILAKATSAGGCYLLPGHRHVLQQLVHRMRNKLQGTKIHSLVMPELSG